MNKAAADKAAEDLKYEQAVRCQYEERVTQVEQALKDAADKYKSLEEKSKAQVTDLAEALKEAEEARVESYAAREEIKQAGQIVAGKPFLLQCEFGNQSYVLLTQLWGALDVFVDLPKSAADATPFFQGQEGHAMEKQF